MTPPDDRSGIRFVDAEPFEPTVWKPELGYSEPGIYMTTKPIGDITADMLVLVESDAAGDLRVLEPAASERNQWRFGLPGVRVGPDDLAGLRKLPPEGFYVLRHALRFDSPDDPGTSGLWLEGSIVQLGYTRRAEPLVFLAQYRKDGEHATLWFSERGVRFEQADLDHLWPVSWYEEPDA